MNVYLALTGDRSPAYGARYLNELLNFIPSPRIWPSKPLIGIDYAKWRGFESEDSEEGELGVNTTVSAGMIGGGVLNFGEIVGPVAAGMLMALWTGLLIRWWEQRKSLLRLVLFMLGAGLTFNLGRDISMLVLWPLYLHTVLSGLPRFVPSSAFENCRSWQVSFPLTSGQCRW